MIAEQAIAEHKPARTPMWCDDFDMDLLKLLPEVERLLAPCQGIRLYTTCNPTHVRINLPSVWHQRGGLTCYVGFLRPDDPLPEKGPQPAYCMTFSPVVEATAEEMFRDLWCHNLVWVQVSSPKMRELWRDSAQIWNAHALTGSFNILLYALRGWEPVPENRLYFHRCRVLKSISRAASRLRRLYDRFLILDLAATFVENRVTDFSPYGRSPLQGGLTIVLDYSSLREPRDPVPIDLHDTINGDNPEEMDREDEEEFDCY